MKTLKKISLSDVKVMDAQEMKMIVGGSGSNWEGSGAEGMVRSCSECSKEECFGPAIEIIGDKLVKGECEWRVFPELKYAGCVFVG